MNSVDAHPSRFQSWYAVTLIIIASMVNVLDRTAFSILLPAIKTDLQLTDSEIGLISGIAFSIPYALCSIPLARWADRGSRRNVLVFALTVWSLMTTFSGAVQNFWQALIARIGVGAGEAGGAPATLSLLCDYVPLHHRPFIFGLLGVGAIFGAAAGNLVPSMLEGMIGWRYTFVALGVPGIGLALLLHFTLREPVRGRFDRIAETPSPRQNPREIIASLWNRPTYVFLLINGAAGGFIANGHAQWWPSFFVRLHDLTLPTVGYYLGVVAAVGPILGMFAGGLAGTRLSKRDVRLPVFLAAALVGLSPLFLIGALLVQDPFSAAILMSFAGFCGGLPAGPVGAAMYSAIPSNLRATGAAISLLAISLIGYSLGPLFVGVISDVFFPVFGDDSLRYGMIGALLLAPLQVFSLYRAAQALPADLAKEN